MEESLQPCPLCGREATVSDEPIHEGFPEPLAQVICGECGQYLILSRFAHPERVDGSTTSFPSIDLSQVQELNHAAIADGQNMIWVDGHDIRAQWDRALQEHAHRLGGKPAFAVRVIPSK